MSQEEKNRVEGGVLYLVATPIGNLADLSERAKKVLSEVDFIAAEDTRNTIKLLSVFGIRKPCVSYFEHNKRRRGEEILERIENGEACALVTDAGTPAISDPGEDIVRLAAEKGIRVTSIPGCCAAVNALALSALATGRFAFEGFLSANKGERRKQIEALKDEPRTMILYEAPHKLRDTLCDLAAVFSDRKISLCRELTKLNEEILRMTVSEAVTFYEEKEPRGEYVLVLEGAEEHYGADYKRTTADTSLLSLSPEAHVAHYEKEGLSRMDATKKAASDRGMTKSELYKILNYGK